MKFSGQKFFIFLGFFLVPILFVGALLREPVVNRGLLRVTLAIMKSRLGTSVKARTWKVDLSKFAVAIEGIEFERGKLRVTASELRAEFSPLFLLVGRVYLSKVWVNEVFVEGTLPVLKDKTPDEKPFHLDNELKKIGEGIVNFQNSLDKQKVGFESLEVSSLSVKTDRVQIRDADLKIENFGTGHVKAEIVIEELSGAPQIPNISRVLAAVVLYNDHSNTYVSVRRLNAEISSEGKLHSTVEIKGRVPGDISLDIMSDLTQLHKWMVAQKNPKLVAWAKENKFSGYVELTGSAVAEGPGLKKAETKIRAKNIKFNELAVAELTTEFDFEGKDWRLSESKGRFASTTFDPGAKNVFSANNVRVEGGKLLGEVRLERMGLCAMLRGLGIPECFLDLVTTGSISLDGAYDPLKLNPKINLDLEPFTVYTDPDEGKRAAEGRLLKTKAAKLVGTVEIRDKDLDFTDLKIKFANGSELGAQGNLKYKPTRLFLKVSNETARFDDILQDFLDQEIGGVLKAQATIDYDYQRAKESGKTDIFADYLIKELKISGMPLGDLTGKLQFVKKILDFRPIVRMGPGTLKITGQIGRIDPSLDEGQMSIYAQANDYEILVPRENSSPVFDSVANFETHLKGSLKKGSSHPFGGEVNVDLRSMTSFGIPFERGTLKGYVDLNGLKIERLEALKENSKTLLTGFLGSRATSRVEFSSQYLPIRQLGYAPDIERLFQTGEIGASGWWSMEKGWAIDAQCRQIKVGPTNFKELDVRFASSKKTGAKGESGFFASAKSADGIDVRYDSLEESLIAKLKDSGIFLALTLVKKWENVPEFLKIKGDVDIAWSPNAGNISLNSLDFQVTDRFNREDRRLLSLDKPTEILFRNSSFQGEAHFSSGSNKFKVVSEGGDLVGDGRLSVRLVDLFIPDIIRLVDGTVQFHSRWKPLGHSLVASAKFEDTSSYLPFLGTELRGITGVVNINGSQLQFANITGKSGEGSVVLGGTMALSGSRALNLTAHTQSLPMRVSRDVDMVVTGDFAVAGKGLPYQLTGKARIERGLLRKEFSEAGIKTAMLEKPTIYFDVPFEVLPNFQIKNSLTDAFITGQGRLLGNNLVPSISGRFDVVKGNLYAKDNEFVLSYARVEIPTDTSVDPIKINVQASTVKDSKSIDYRIFLTAEGEPDNLRLNFRSEPSLTQKEVISLLTLGYIPQEQLVSASTGTQGSGVAQGASAEAFQLLFGQALGKGIQKQTGFDVQVGTSSNLKQDDTIPKVTVYRRLNDRMSATFGKSLDVARPENNFKIDYRLLQNLNLTGVWENPDDNRNSLGLDLRLEFEIK